MFYCSYSPSPTFSLFSIIHFLNLKFLKSQKPKCTNPKEEKEEKKIIKMLVHHGMGQLFVFLICVLTTTAESSIYEVLKAHGLPKGLLPKGVKNFTLDNSGNFMVHLDEACNAKIVNEFHYERNVSGRLSYGEINSLSGISAKDLFLWIQVKKIYVTDSGSGVIYFDCGVVDKQFSLSSFENPEDCVAADLDHLFQTVSKSQSRKLQYKLDQGT